MATKQQYTLSTLGAKSTAGVNGSASVTFLTAAREVKVENLSTALSVYCQFDGDTASSASYPIRPGVKIEWSNLASTAITFANISTAGGMSVETLGLL